MDPCAPPDVDRRVARTISPVDRRVARTPSHGARLYNMSPSPQISTRRAHNNTVTGSQRVCQRWRLAFSPLYDTPETQKSITRKTTPIFCAPRRPASIHALRSARDTPLRGLTPNIRRAPLFDSVREAIARGEREITECKKDLALAPHWR